jgi:hypothetical protein
VKHQAYSNYPLITQSINYADNNNQEQTKVMNTLDQAGVCEKQEAIYGQYMMLATVR